MLRAKQLGTLSQAARNFYLNGPRCGSLDGAACTCSDDENCVSKRGPNTAIRQSKAIVVPITPLKNISPCRVNAVGSKSHQKSSYPASVQNVISHSSSKTSSVPRDRKNDDGDCASRNLQESSKLPAGHSVNSSRYSMCSDLLNNSFQSTELGTTTCLTDSTQRFHHNDDISKDKSCNKADYSKGQLISSVSFVEECKSSSTGYSYEAFPKSSKPKDKQYVSEAISVTNRSTYGAKKQKQYAPQRTENHADRFISNEKPGGRITEKKMTGKTTHNAGHIHKFHHPMRAPRSHAGAASSSSRSVNSRYVVEQYYQTLQRLKWGPTTEEALDNLEYKLDPFQANQVLKSLHDHAVALEFFNWLKTQPGFMHDDHTYTTMIGILGQGRQFGAMRRLLQDMINDNCHPTVVTYNRLIHAYGRANILSDAIHVFHEMQEAGCKPDRVTYCTLIDIHAKAGYLEVAMDLYERMQDVGLSPDTFTYSAMVNCLGKAGHLADAYRLFCEMIQHGCLPNLVTYNIMIALQAKARNYPTVVKLYRDMQASGFRPDKVTYNIVMQVLGNCGRLDEVEKVFNEMSIDWVPDEPVYGLLVDLWGKAGNVDKAWTWYHAMLAAGLQPNVPTCNSLLSAFLKAHRLSDAHDMLVNMLGLGLVPSLRTYTLLLSCCTESHIEMGLCCKLMAITGHPTHAFLLSLPDAEPDGANVRVHAHTFFDLLQTEDRESKRGLVDAIVDFLYKSDLKEEAGLIWEVAAEMNIYPDSVREKKSSYWLINLHVMSEGTAVTALSRTLAWFQRRMLSSGVRPSRIDIITGWGRRSRVTGSSLVRQCIQDLLNVFQFPFSAENGNSGCFVGCGESLNRWLLNSYVERMHLL